MLGKMKMSLISYSSLFVYFLTVFNFWVLSSGLKFQPEMSTKLKNLTLGENFSISCIDQNEDVFWTVPMPEYNEAIVTVNGKGNRTLQIKNVNSFQHGQYYCSTKSRNASISFILLLVDVSKRVRSLSNTSTKLDSKHKYYRNESLKEATSTASTISEIKISAKFIVPAGIIGIIIISMALYWIVPHFKKKKLDENEESIELQEMLNKSKEVESINFKYYLQNFPAPLIDVDLITVGEKIGEGQFGEVCRGELNYSNNKENDRKIVAVKKLKGKLNHTSLEEFLKEVEVMAFLNHPQILSVLGICYPKDLSNLWVITDHMEHGDLKNVLRTRDPSLTQENKYTIIHQIATGMKYMAAMHHVHRDLACRNILLDTNLNIKIADLGLSRDIYTSDYYKVKNVGDGSNKKRYLPVRWMSPESLAHGEFTTKTDVFSYGVVLWEILTHGGLPHQGYSMEQVMDRIISGITLPIHDSWPQHITIIMQLCWVTNPKGRITFREICNRLSH